MIRHRMNRNPSLAFWGLGLLSLVGSVLAGNLAMLTYELPQALRDVLPFRMLRPMHVSLAVGWLFAGITGFVYYALREMTGRGLPVRRLWIHWGGYVLVGLLIVGAYALNEYGGREYWEFPPMMAVGIMLLWLLFGSVLIGHARHIGRAHCCDGTGHFSRWPTYLWMWLTGWIFFLFTFIETYLWLFPFWGQTVVRDITVQWKAQGALVGAWNMFIYGTSLYLMAHTKGGRRVACSPAGWFLYLLGLVNLIFGWAHHVYPVPNATWIRGLAYAVSMTELIVLARMIAGWRHPVAPVKGPHFYATGQWLRTTEVWIFINLILAIAISVPVVNLFTHGTHFTVAHAMGTTIGINTPILLAALFYVLEREGRRVPDPLVRHLLRFFNGGLALFWLGLLAAGAVKAYDGWVKGLEWAVYQHKVRYALWVCYGASFLLIYVFLKIAWHLWRRPAGSLSEKSETAAERRV